MMKIYAKVLAVSMKALKHVVKPMHRND
jgi:hypothetical protein